MTPALFYSTLRVRRRLERGPSTAEAVAGSLYVLTTVDLADAEETVQTQVDQLRRCGIVVTELRGTGVGRRSEHSLTPLGHASLGWRSPPRDPRVDVRRWAGEVARAIGQAHRVNHHAMLRAAMAGPEVLRARGRLCDALEADLGWSFVVIERHFGMRVGAAEAAAEAWRRGRESIDAAEKRLRRLKASTTVPIVPVMLAASGAPASTITIAPFDPDEPVPGGPMPEGLLRCRAIEAGRRCRHVHVSGGLCALHGQRKRMGIHVEEVRG